MKSRLRLNRETLRVLQGPVTRVGAQAGLKLVRLTPLVALVAGAGGCYSLVCIPAL